MAHERPPGLEIARDIGGAKDDDKQAAVRRIDGPNAERLGRRHVRDRPTQKPLPDRLSLDPRSPHFDEEVLRQGVGIRFNGQEKTNVEEYCISEGWIRSPPAAAATAHGNPMTMTLKGKVEPYYEGGDDNKGPGEDAEA